MSDNETTKGAKVYSSSLSSSDVEEQNVGNGSENGNDINDDNNNSSSNSAEKGYTDDNGTQNVGNGEIENENGEKIHSVFFHTIEYVTPE